MREGGREGGREREKERDNSLTFCPIYTEGFGNATRIDYSTGHEMKFVAFLCCLMKMKVIPQECAAAVVIHVITR